VRELEKARTEIVGKIERLDTAISVIGELPEISHNRTRPKRHRRMSAAARKRIGAAKKAWWAAKAKMKKKTA